MDYRELFTDETKTTVSRIGAIEHVVGAVFLILLAGFGYLQLIQQGRYTDLAERNRIRTIPMVAPRGRILDRDGRVIVDNRSSFSIALLRENTKNLETNLPAISAGLELDIAAVREDIKRFKTTPSFQPIIIKEDATEADVAFVDAHRLEYPELEIMMVPRRAYPKDGLAAHVLGYVGEVSADMLESHDNAAWQPGDLVGKSGIEKEYNDFLTGKDGYKRVIVNSRGREMGRLEQVDPVPGNELRLTIDLDLQRVAEQELGDRSGAVVVLNPQTGDVLAMVSHPDFDPNQFAGKMTPADWNALQDDPRKPLLNRALQARFSPGSVFKVIMAAAGLEAGTLKPDTTYYCGGTVMMYGTLFHCHGGHGHGTVGLHQAIVNSCNIFFYNVGKLLGIDRISYYAHKMGLGEKTGIDLPNEDPGLIPSPEWKLKTKYQPWYLGETISVAIGQGPVGVTPLQLVRTVSGIALGGVFHTPRVVTLNQNEGLKGAAANASNERFALKPETVDIISRGLWGVVNEGGTGFEARIPGYDICGKTGTVQVVGSGAKVNHAAGSEFGNHGWFVGFAPRENPEIAVAVIVEHGGYGGDISAPIAHEIFRTYFMKKQGKQTPGTVIQLTALHKPVAVEENVEAGTPANFADNTKGAHKP
ncbi:MAG: penicillin-binding protein 2 [Acidobacteriia bacterium]|nr:penicillin-binding protein 2 [Terriglobia bacterium]